MIKIYGSSDDLIIVEGDINGEFYASIDDGDYFAFSNGCVVFIQYDDEGVWRLKPIYKNESYQKIFEAASNDSEKYSDIVEIKDNIKWVLQGSEYLRITYN